MSNRGRTLVWGSGDGGTDTNLYRGAANQLKSDDAFYALLGLVPVSAPKTIANIRDSSLTASASQTPTAGTVYFGELYIPFNKTITGIGWLVGSTGGTDKVIVALYNSAGAVVANSALAGTTCGSATTYQEIALTATYDAIGPAQYYVSVSANGTTCRIGLTTACSLMGGNAAGVFGTLDAITVPTARAASPYVYVY